MTTKEVLAELHISHDTLQRRIRDGRIKPLPKQNPALDREPYRFARADVLRLRDAARPVQDRSADGTDAPGG